MLDITRWLPEHPGGSTIIPEQALDCDATVFFECYHVSRQSFLYLREFYIGELSPEDRLRVPPPNEQQRRGLTVQASAAFLEQLKRATPWRLRPEDMDAPTVFKSF